MRVLKKLVGLHKFLFSMAVLFTFLATPLNLYWNGFLADMLDRLGSSVSFEFGREGSPLLEMLILGIAIILLLAMSESVLVYETIWFIRGDSSIFVVSEELMIPLMNSNKWNTREMEGAYER